MRSIRICLLWVASSFFVTAISIALPCSAEGYGTVFSLAGTHSVYGPYHGELEIRPIGGSGIRATRVVEYDNFEFDGFKVQEAWVGSGELRGDRITLSFSLRQADFLESVDGQARSGAQFAQSFPFSYALTLSAASQASFTLPNGNYQEGAVGMARAADRVPLWSDERQEISSFGDTNKVIGGVAFSTIFKPFLNRYHEDPQVKASLAKPQCQSQNQWIVRDPTDFDFLRSHPRTIRVANKISDKIAFAEASLRTNAYGPSLAEKAAAFDASFPQQNLNPNGLYTWALDDEKGNLLGQSPNGDSVLYTGMYAGSQAMRWLVTKDNAALENFKRATRGLMLAMDVTGDPTNFARAVEPLSPGEKPAGAWKQGAGQYQNVKFQMPGNNDMVQGIFHAFAWAFEILPEGDPFLAEVAAHAERLSALHSSNNSTAMLENRFLSYGLAALGTGKSADLLKFTSLSLLVTTSTDRYQLGRGFYYGGVGDWSGQNLLMVSKITRVLIAKNISKKWSASTLGLDKKILREARQNLMDTWAVYASAKRDALTVAAHTFGTQNSLGLNEDTAPKKWNKMESWPTNLSDSIWSLREIPISSGPHLMLVDYTLKPDWCMSYWPGSAWQSFDKKYPMNYFYQSKSLYPIFEGASLYMENLWMADFQLQGAGGWRTRSGRLDFLHMYWMSRLAGLFGAGT